jgi:hypothetical protein
MKTTQEMIDKLYNKIGSLAYTHKKTSTSTDSYRYNPIKLENILKELESPIKLYTETHKSDYFIFIEVPFGKQIKWITGLPLHLQPKKTICSLYDLIINEK